MAVKKYYAKSSGYLVHGDRANHRYISKFFKNGRWQYIYPEDRHKRADNAGRNARITLKPGMTMADAQKAAYDKAYAKSMRRTERHNRVVRGINKIRTMGNKKTTYKTTTDRKTGTTTYTKTTSRVGSPMKSVSTRTTPGTARSGFNNAKGTEYTATKSRRKKVKKRINAPLTVKGGDYKQNSNGTYSLSDQGTKKMNTYNSLYGKNRRSKHKARNRR